MKIECIKEKILYGVASAEKVTGKNLSLPILSSLYLRAEKNNLTVKGTNLDLGIEIQIPVKVLEEGEVVVPGSLLNGILSNLQEEKIILETRESELFIITKNTSSTLKTVSAEDFPLIPKTTSSKIIEIDTQNFVQGFQSVWYSAAVTSMKPELSSVYVYAEKEELVFVATDSFRLAEKRVSIKKEIDMEGILIPFKNIPEILRFLEAGKGEVSLSLDSGQVSFSREGGYLVSRVIEGLFPDYRQIIPKEAKTEVVVLKQDLLQALKLSHVFSDTFNQVILQVFPKEKNFEITTKNANLGENKTSIEAVVKGEDSILSFNYKYITDCFSSIKNDSLTLFFHGVGKPLLIRGLHDKTFLYVVMPMNK